MSGCPVRCGQLAVVNFFGGMCCDVYVSGCSLIKLCFGVWQIQVYVEVSYFVRLKALWITCAECGLAISSVSEFRPPDDSCEEEFFFSLSPSIRGWWNWMISILSSHLAWCCINQCISINKKKTSRCLYHNKRCICILKVRQSVPYFKYHV